MIKIESIYRSVYGSYFNKDNNNVCLDVSFFICNVYYPGPVNTVILSTSLNHGLKRSLPYISGATIGFTLLLIFMAFGLQSLLTQFPVVLKILAVCGTLFVCYIGIKIILSAANISISSVPVEQMIILILKMGSYYNG